MVDMVDTDLFKFAFCRRKNMDFVDYIKELANKISSENWGTDFKILKNYINFTFEKLAIDYNNAIEVEKWKYISMREEDCCFNTGLFNDYYEPIYAYFKKNLYADNTTHIAKPSPWFLVGFKTPSDYELNNFETLPHRAQFFSDASELVYDYRLEIRAQVQHILGDPENLSRLPESYREMKKPILVQMFKGAIETAEKRVASNYKLAVPQYYKKSLQLLIPLNLEEDTKADLALVLRREGNIYTARTCLTLDMAYNNARLIVKPESEWLQISN